MRRPRKECGLWGGISCRTFGLTGVFGTGNACLSVGRGGMVVGLCSRGACSDEEFPVVPPSAQDCCFRNAAWRLSGKLLHFDEFGVGALCG